MTNVSVHLLTGEALTVKCGATNPSVSDVIRVLVSLRPLPAGSRYELFHGSDKLLSFAPIPAETLNALVVRLRVPAAEIKTHEVAGIGSCSMVYKGEMNGEEVAVKVYDRYHCHGRIRWTSAPLRAFCSTENARENDSIINEIDKLAHLRHPNLVQIFGAVDEEDFAFFHSELRIVMNFCHGGCLFELLHNSDHIDLCWAQTWRMCDDVAQAMCFLHTHDPPILMPRLSSLKVLLDSEVKSLADMPCFKVSGWHVQGLFLDVMPDYPRRLPHPHGWTLSPETHAGGFLHNSTACDDVWAFGMLLFEIICREIPFEEEEPAAIPRIIRSGQTPDMDAVPPDCPSLLRDLMLQCWCCPGLRPNCLAVCAALDSCRDIQQGMPSSK